MAGDGISGFPIQDIIQSGSCRTLISQADKKLKGIGDFPAGIAIDEDEFLVHSRHLVSFSIPFQVPLVEELSFLYERGLEIQPWCGSRFADRFAKLRYDSLLGFVRDRRAAVGGEKQCYDKYRYSYRAVSHGVLLLILSRFKRGRTLLPFSSVMILFPIFRTTFSIVSR